MPTVTELMTLVARGCKNPAIDPQLFPNTPVETYHTSTKKRRICVGVDLSNGTEYQGLRNAVCDYSSYIRLVKTGQ